MVWFVYTQCVLLYKWSYLMNRKEKLVFLKWWKKVNFFFQNLICRDRKQSHRLVISVLKKKLNTIHYNQISYSNYIFNSMSLFDQKIHLSSKEKFEISYLVNQFTNYILYRWTLFFFCFPHLRFCWPSYPIHIPNQIL